MLSATDTRDSVLSTGVRDTIISVDSFYIDGFEPSQRTNNIVEPSSLGRHSRFLESTISTISEDHSSIIPPRYTTIARPSQHQRSSSMQPTQQRQQQSIPNKKKKRFHQEFIKVEIPIVIGGIPFTLSNGGGNQVDENAENIEDFLPVYHVIEQESEEVLYVP